MRSIQIDRCGDPEVLVERDIPRPHPGPDEVLIRLEWSGINFMDVHTRESKCAGSRTYPVRPREATDGQGVDVVFDAVGRTTLRDSFRATRSKVNYGSVSRAVRDLDPIEPGEAGSLFLTRPRLADHLQDAATIQRRAADLFAALLDVAQHQRRQALHPRRRESGARLAGGAPHDREAAPRDRRVVRMSGNSRAPRGVNLSW